MTRRVATLVALFTAACATSPATEPAPDVALERCVPTTPDSVLATLYLTLRPGGTEAEPVRRPLSERERRLLALALLAVRDALPPPEQGLRTDGTISLYRGAAVPGTSPEPPPLAPYTSEALEPWRRGRVVLEPSLDIAATLHGDGGLSGIERVSPPSVMPGLDRAVADAIAGVGESHVLAGLLQELRAAGWAALRAGRRGDGDSLRISLGVGVSPDTVVGSLPLLQVRLPVYDGAALAAPEPGNPPPRYPLDARSRGESGEVLVQFVVTAAGRIDPATVRVLRATSRDFARVVRDVLPRYRFRPAVIGGCPRPMIAQMPFEFDVIR